MKRPVPPVSVRRPSGTTPVHAHPLMDRILRGRGVTSIDEVTYDLKSLLPANMKGLDEAADIISEHILNGSNILIIGDYDCDGATATSVAVEGLRLLGAEKVDYLVPDRAIHGYGLTPAIVELAAKKKPDLIVTVDNGISSFAGAEAVKSLPHPCDLVITDHHLAAESGQVPAADAIVNPNQPGCPFQSKAIAGCGVMFYVIIKTRALMNRLGHFENQGRFAPKLAPLLDLVALGTVADVVPLDMNNRILVSMGLERINSGLGRPGINALLDVAKRDIGYITAQDFGFGVGPRLNAAGRLDDMSRGIQCLLSGSDNEASRIALELNELNLARREIEGGMLDIAESEAEKYQDEGKDAVVLYGPDWHEGVVGIVASRIKEMVNRPVACFTDTEEALRLRAQIDAAQDESQRRAALANYEDREVKGSFRSVSGVHLKHALDRIHKSHPHIISKFGGHAMAAGGTIRYAYLEQFRELFESEVSAELTDDVRAGKIEVDAVGLEDCDCTIETADMIAAHGPWGQHFPEPLFKDRFIVEKVRVMKDVHLKLSLRHPNSDTLVEGVAFNILEEGDLPQELSEVEVIYKMDVNRFRGNETLQLMIESLSSTHELNHEMINADPLPHHRLSNHSDQHDLSLPF